MVVGAGTSCQNHADRPVDEHCFACHAPLCGACTRRLSGEPHCTPCFVPRYRRRRRVRRVGGTLAVLALVGGLVWLFEDRKAQNRARERYGQSADRVRTLTAALDRDPCSRQSLLAFHDITLERKAEEDAVPYLIGYVDACTPDADVLQRVVTALRNAGRSREALVHADRLVLLQPTLAAAFGLRGALRREEGQSALAIADLRHAFELDPTDRSTALHLSRLLEAAEDPCAAADVLDGYVGRVHNSESERLGRRATVLRKAGGCDRVTLSGDSVTIPLRRAMDVMIVDVRFNDRVTAPLVLDTGASSIAISPALVERLGLSGTSSGSVLVGTAGGVTRAGTYLLESVTVGGARVEKVRALSSRSVGGEGHEGLLGNTFLRHFDVQVDMEARGGARGAGGRRLGWTVRSAWGAHGRSPLGWPRHPRIGVVQRAAARAEQGVEATQDQHRPGPLPPHGRILGRSLEGPLERPGDPVELVHRSQRRPRIDLIACQVAAELGRLPDERLELGEQARGRLGGGRAHAAGLLLGGRRSDHELIRPDHRVMIRAPSIGRGLGC